MSIANNKIRVRGKQFHCVSVTEQMTVSEYQGGMITSVTDENHPLYQAIKWDDFLVVYNNKLYYAIHEVIESSSILDGVDVVRLYDVSSENVDDIDTSTTPGWIIMDMRDLAVEIDDNTYIRWRYKNSGEQKTMDFRVNYTDILPRITSDIVGQIFWSKTDLKDFILPDGTVTDYEAGVYLCEESRYVRLDFDENTPAFLKYITDKIRVVTHTISDTETTEHHFLQLCAGTKTDETTGEKHIVGPDEYGDVLCEVDGEEWYTHVNIDIVKPVVNRYTDNFIPSDISEEFIVANNNLDNKDFRDSYGHLKSYRTLSNINTRYRWEEI